MPFCDLNVNLLRDNQSFVFIINQYIKQDNVQQKIEMSDRKLQKVGHNVRCFKKFFIYTAIPWPVKAQPHAAMLHTHGGMY